MRSVTFWIFSGDSKCTKVWGAEKVGLGGVKELATITSFTNCDWLEYSASIHLIICM